MKRWKQPKMIDTRGNITSLSDKQFRPSLFPSLSLFEITMIHFINDSLMRMPSGYHRCAEVPPTSQDSKSREDLNFTSFHIFLLFCSPHTYPAFIITPFYCNKLLANILSSDRHTIFVISFYRYFLRYLGNSVLSLTFLQSFTALLVLPPP